MPTVEAPHHEQRLHYRRDNYQSDYPILPPELNGVTRDSLHGVPVALSGFCRWAESALLHEARLLRRGPAPRAEAAGNAAAGFCGAGAPAIGAAGAADAPTGAAAAAGC